RGPAPAQRVLALLPRARAGGRVAPHLDAPPGGSAPLRPRGALVARAPPARRRAFRPPSRSGRGEPGGRFSPLRRARGGRSVTTPRVLVVAARVLRQLRRDKRTLALIVLQPLLIMGVFGYAFGGDVTGARLAVAN